LEGSGFSQQLAPLDEWIEREQVREARTEFDQEDEWEDAWEQSVTNPFDNLPYDPYSDPDNCCTRCGYYGNECEC
jgi:hypothetical protein